MSNRTLKIWDMFYRSHHDGGTGHLLFAYHEPDGSNTLVSNFESPNFNDNNNDYQSYFYFRDKDANGIDHVDEIPSNFGSDNYMNTIYTVIHPCTDPPEWGGECNTGACDDCGCEDFVRFQIIEPIDEGSNAWGDGHVPNSTKGDLYSFKIHVIESSMCEGTFNNVASGENHIRFEWNSPSHLGPQMEIGPGSDEFQEGFYGCTDDTACNYNPDATFNCPDPQFSGNVTIPGCPCDYPEGLCDCDGNPPVDTCDCQGNFPNFPCWNGDIVCGLDDCDEVPECDEGECNSLGYYSSAIYPSVGSEQWNFGFDNTYYIGWCNTDLGRPYCLEWCEDSEYYETDYKNIPIDNDNNIDWISYPLIDEFNMVGDTSISGARFIEILENSFRFNNDIVSFSDNSKIKILYKRTVNQLTIIKNSTLAGLESFQDLIVGGDWLIIDGVDPLNFLGDNIGLNENGIRGFLIGIETLDDGDIIWKLP